MANFAANIPYGQPDPLSSIFYEPTPFYGISIYTTIIGIVKGACCNVNSYFEQRNKYSVVTELALLLNLASTFVKVLSFNETTSTLEIVQVTDHLFSDSLLYALFFLCERYANIFRVISYIETAIMGSTISKDDDQLTSMELFRKRIWIVMLCIYALGLLFSMQWINTTIISIITSILTTPKSIASTADDFVPEYIRPLISINVFLEIIRSGEDIILRPLGSIVSRFFVLSHSTCQITASRIVAILSTRHGSKFIMFVSVLYVSVGVFLMLRKAINSMSLSIKIEGNADQMKIDEPYNVKKTQVFQVGRDGARRRAYHYVSAVSMLFAILSVFAVILIFTEFKKIHISWNSSSQATQIPLPSIAGGDARCRAEETIKAIVSNFLMTKSCLMSREESKKSNNIFYTCPQPIWCQNITAAEATVYDCINNSPIGGARTLEEEDSRTHASIKQYINTFEYQYTTNQYSTSQAVPRYYESTMMFSNAIAKDDVNLDFMEESATVYYCLVLVNVVTTLLFCHISWSMSMRIYSTFMFPVVANILCLDMISGTVSSPNAMRPHGSYRDCASHDPGNTKYFAVLEFIDKKVGLVLLHSVFGKKNNSAFDDLLSKVIARLRNLFFILFFGNSTFVNVTLLVRAYMFDVSSDHVLTGFNFDILLSKARTLNFAISVFVLIFATR